MPEGQLILRKKGKIAEGSYLSSERAKKIADMRWGKVREAKRLAAEAAAQPAPSSARRPGPCDELLLRPGQNPLDSLPPEETQPASSGDIKPYQKKWHGLPVSVLPANAFIGHPFRK